MTVTYEQWQAGKSVEGVPPWDGTGIPLPVDPATGWPEVPGGGARLHTNLFTTPSFELAGAPRVVARNEYADPKITDATGWTVDPETSGGTATVSAVSGLLALGFPADTGVQAVWDTAQTAAGGMFQSDHIPVTPNQVLVAGAWASVSVADYPLLVGINWYDAGGARVGGAGQYVSRVPAGQPVWLDMSMDVKAPVTAATARLHVGTDIYNASPAPVPFPAGTTVIVTGIVVDTLEITPQGKPVEFFDGDTPADGSFTYAWEGAPNASASTKSGITPTGVTPISGSQVSNVLHSTEWAERGDASVLVTPRPDGVTAGFNARVDVGKTYTALATVRTTERLPSRPYINYGLRDTAVAGLEPGVYPLRLTFTTTPLGGTSVQFYGSVDGLAWFDSVLLVEGEYAGPYFDGDTPEDAEYIYAWTGEPHNSTSTATPAAAEDENFDPAESTVAEVQAYLGEHPEQTEYVLDRERSGKARTTLIGA